MPEPDCLFCRIASGEIPTDFVREDQSTVAFRDIDPQAPVHVLVIPREHHANALDLATADPALLTQVLVAATEVARSEGLVDRGYRLVMNAGADAGQTVFHAHVHVLGGRGLGWPPG